MSILVNLHVLLIAAAGLSFTSCSGQSTDKITMISFENAARSFQNEVSITKDSLIISQNNFRGDRQSTKDRRPFTNAEWNTLLETLDGVELTAIPDLVSPTQKREVDAAAFGTITITTSKESYTHSFDDYNPHATLMPLMNHIRKLMK